MANRQTGDGDGEGTLGAVLWGVAVTGDSGGLQTKVTGPSGALVDWGVVYDLYWLSQ